MKKPPQKPSSSSTESSQVVNLRGFPPEALNETPAALEARPDVATFTGPVLDTDLEVVGRPVVELAHTSDNPHADVFVRICDVDAKGRSRNVSDGFVRLGGAPIT